MDEMNSGEDLTEHRWADRKLEAILRTARDGFWIIDDRGRILDANESLARMLGYSADELLSMAVSDLEAVETAAEVSQHIARIQERGHERFESQLRRKDGQIIDIEASVTCFDADGRQLFTFIHDITERKRSERALQKLAFDLGERVKELNCLHGISDLVEIPGISFEEIIAGTVDLIPPAWQYPEITCARITLEGQEFHTENYAPSPWQQTADILARGEQIGVVEVGYLEERPKSDEGPFLKEERALLDTIAKRMGEISERMQGQRQIGQQHQFLQNILDSLPHPFYVINTQDLTIELANAAAEADGQQGTLTCFALAHGRDLPCDQENYACPLQEVMSTKGPVVVEHVHTHGDGTRRDVEVHGYPVLDPAGNVVEMIEYAIDITERKRAEQALRESEARWRSLTQTSPDHVLTLDTDLKIQFANFPSPGLTVEELIGMPLYTLVDQERQAEIKTILEGAVETGTPTRYETVYHAPDGEDIFYESHVAARKLPGSDKVIGLTVSARDITVRKRAEAALSRARDELEQRVEERTAELQSLNISLRGEIAVRQRAEEELRASEERFRQLAENTEDIIWLMEPDSGRLLYVSPAYERVLCWPDREAPEGIGQLWSNMHPDDLDLIPRDHVETWIGKEIGFRIILPGDKVRWIRARVFPVYDENGQIYRVVGIASDITEQKQANAALIEAERLAIAGRMAASLAHEINNPLQAAIGCLDLSLEQLEQGKEPQQHLQVTAQALDRASRVVAQLHALHYPADIERREAVDLNNLLENMLVLIQKRCQDQQVEVYWQAAPGLPQVPLMPDAIQQVFLNLLLNALDAMPQGGQLWVSTGQLEEPTRILVQIRDSGTGISPDGLERIFEPFHSSKPDSLGLGLFISHSIVQDHGGQIEVQSREGEGTTFSIWLPLPGPGTD